jgi:hypothetical protein
MDLLIKQISEINPESLKENLKERGEKAKEKEEKNLDSTKDELRNLFDESKDLAKLFKKHFNYNDKDEKIDKITKKFKEGTWVQKMEELNNRKNEQGVSIWE